MIIHYVPTRVNPTFLGDFPPIRNNLPQGISHMK